ncbi:MAG TPA: hypothetical protein VGX93_08540, partial [Chthoniobacterales bacterium]|nr:hypothetical protein [Chthoniobacterales bacterium]
KAGAFACTLISLDHELPIYKCIQLQYRYGQRHSKHGRNIADFSGLVWCGCRIQDEAELK